jgi:hypothetical protein
MRRMPPSVSAWSVFAACLAAATIVGAQSPLAHQPRVEAELAEGLFKARAVEAPFAAEAVTTWTPPAEIGRPVYRSRSRMFRDRAGRVRVEQTFTGKPESTGPHRVFVRTDPQGTVAHMLDTVARTAVEVPLGFANMSTATPARLAVPLAMDCVIGFYGPQTMRSAIDGGGVEDVVGRRLIHAVPATGTRLVTTLALPVGSAAREVTDERWVSRHLGIVLHSRTEDPALGVVEHEVTRLSLAEPAAGTFEVPAEFAPGRPFWPTTMANPHAMLTWARGLAPCERPSR